MTTEQPSSTSLELDIVVPVYNEEVVLEQSIRRLVHYLANEIDRPWRVTIADNASTDATAAIARRLESELNGVRALILPRKGRGYALKQAWGSSAAHVLAYVDVDLSTDLAAIPPLIAPLISGHSDIAIGTRLDRASRVTRGTKREFISRSYNLLLRGALSVSFSDAQCGFKAIRRDVAERLLPLIEDDGWFFDTELLIIAERSGLRIHEIPVDWIDDPDSRVDVKQTALDDLRGMARVGYALARGRLPVEAIYAELGRRPLVQPARPGFFGQVIRFGIVGAFSTVAYALLYLMLHSLVGAQWANLLALLLTTVANTAANRTFTFGVRGRGGAVKHQIQGLIVFAVAWGITSSSLWGLHAANPTAGPVTQIIVLTAANLLATLVRFVMLRLWVFHRRDDRVDPAATSVSTAVLDSEGVTR
ncbi:bifunctional glycosyltransferase family 2/GtrA family protein [soil metagenome]